MSWPDIKKKQMNISRVLIIRLKIQNLRYYEIPDDPTHKLTRIRMTSSWCNHDVIMHSQHVMSATSQLTRQHSGTHQPQAEPSRAKRSRAEPRAEGRIQCSWSYVQPDLRLNLSRSSGQNCFDQILAVWNAIWTIADLFPANLIILDAMVWFDRWDCDQKWWWWINKRRLPDQEASEGHHGGRWWWWRRRCTCLPNYMCWTAKWRDFLFAEWRQN